MVWVSKHPMAVSKSEPVPFHLGATYFTDQFSPNSPGRYFKIHDAHMFFVSEANIHLELNETDSEPKRENDYFKGTGKRKLILRLTVCLLTIFSLLTSMRVRECLTGDPPYSEWPRQPRDLQRCLTAACYTCLCRWGTRPQCLERPFSFWGTNSSSGRHLPGGPSRKRIIFCNIAWPHYKVDNEEVWPVNGIIKFNATLPAARPVFPFRGSERRMRPT